jgi:hypothetical protein
VLDRTVAGTCAADLAPADLRRVVRSVLGRPEPRAPSAPDAALRLDSAIALLEDLSRMPLRDLAPRRRSLLPRLERICPLATKLRRRLVAAREARPPLAAPAPGVPSPVRTAPAATPSAPRRRPRTLSLRTARKAR